ncbi:MAG: hypothetical protein HGA45_34030 [Chloroflexales bacterium]|nr:hypothetical protein [Chloroflexales bacterium]
MKPYHDYHVGERVRLTCPYAGGQVGEQGDIVQVKRDAEGHVLSLDIVFHERAETTRGTTVYPREVEPLGSSAEDSRGDHPELALTLGLR